MEAPASATKGQLQRLIRDSAGSPGSTICPFGRHRGKLFREIPDSYLQWCIEEAKVNRDNALYDPEPNCKVAYRPDEEESQATEWSDDLDLAAVKGYAASSKDLPIAFKAKSQAKRRGQEEGPERMQQDIPVDVQEELDNLQTIIAVLREKHGI